MVCYSSRVTVTIQRLLKLKRPGSYPLYDITISPLTSGTHTFSGTEKQPLSGSQGWIKTEFWTGFSLR
ncbi:MAG: hypothetical protein IPK94_08370 [Saprospiraceae bacterium]|nr:hypothetical protein [Saprospiraceae bacterium]